MQQDQPQTLSSNPRKIKEVRLTSMVPPEKKMQTKNLRNIPPVEETPVLG